VHPQDHHNKLEVALEAERLEKEQLRAQVSPCILLLLMHNLLEAERNALEHADICLYLLRHASNSISHSKPLFCRTHFISSGAEWQMES